MHIAITSTIVSPDLASNFILLIRKCISLVSSSWGPRGRQLGRALGGALLNLGDLSGLDPEREHHQCKTTLKASSLVPSWECRIGIRSRQCMITHKCRGSQQFSISKSDKPNEELKAE